MSQVNITLNTNTVDINTTNNQIVVTDPINPTTVNITQPVTSLVEIITAGPQGPPGPPGPSGSTVNTGSFVTTGSFNAFTSSYNTGSFTGSFSGSFFGTASFVVSSSRAVTSSFAISASQATSASWAPLNAGGSNTQIQFNSGSRLLGTGSFTFNYQNQSLQQGSNITASGLYSHAQGGNTQASGSYSHAEGESTQTIGNRSHAEGYNTIAQGEASHAEGVNTQAIGSYSHAEGESTQAIGIGSHAEGRFTSASGYTSHAEGVNTQALGDYSHAEGAGTSTIGQYSHAEGNATKTGVTTAFQSTISSGLVTIDSTYGDVTSNFTPGGYLYTYDEPFDGTANRLSLLIDTVTWDGNNTLVQLVDTGINSSTAYVGDLTYLKNNYTFGGDQTIPGDYSHTEGNSTIAIGLSSHAEGASTQAIGATSHAEGNSTQAIGITSHAEGNITKAIGVTSHAEGDNTQAKGDYSHAEGQETISSGSYSHAEGYLTIAQGIRSHAEGIQTQAIGDYSHAEGLNTIASGLHQHVQGQFNISSSVDSAFIVGNGIDDNNRSNLIYAHDSIVEITGSLDVLGSITGSLFGTASFATSSSIAVTSSFATTSSFAISSSRAVTSSFAISSSWAPMRPGGSDTQIQFNSGSALTGRSSFTFNYISQSLQQGELTIASGSYSHAEGYSTTALGTYSHAEGNASIAIGPYSHAEGGGAQAIGTSSHAEGAGTIAAGDFQHVQGRFNITSSANSAFIIGNGANLNNRSNLVFASGSQFQVTGSIIATQGFTGSLFGTSSWAINAATASNIVGGKATHIPFFKTDTTLATSSLYQSGSGTVIINQDNATTANPEALYVWQPHPTSFNVISGKGDINNYLQLNIQNTNQGAAASSDVVATANNGSENDNYIDMGINSENFAGFLGGPNDSYLYTHGHNFWIGNINDGYKTYFFNSSSLLPIITLDSNSALITGSLFGTASWASNAVNATNAANATSASYATVADSAVFATTAGNGGVTSIIAGSGITLPFGGTGNVTIVAGGGGGGVTIISGSAVTSSFVNSSTWTFNHDLGTRTPTITVFDSNYNQIIPQNISLDTTSSATITFPTLESGFAIASTGGTTGTALSASYSLFSTYAASASYFPETDPVFVAKSGSLATTGSNVFRGNQTVSGSLFTSGSNTLVGNTSLTGSLSISGSTTQTGNNTLIGTTTLTGSIQIAGNVIPQLSSSFDLGSLTNPWRSIYVQSGSISIQSDIPGGIPAIISNANGNVTFAGAGFQLKSGSFVPFEISSSARTIIRVPDIPANDVGGLSIIGSSDGSYQGVTNAGGLLHLTSNDGQSSRITSDAFGTTAVVAYVGRKARGTAASPLPVQSGDTLTRISTIGWTGPEYGFLMSASSTVASTAIETVALENFTTSSFGTRHTFYNAPLGGTIRTLSAQIDTTGITIPSSSRLFGTASWALNAVSSSNALTASYVNPLKQAVQVTGSLLVTGSTVHTGNITVTGSVIITGSIVMDSTVQTNIEKISVTNPSAYVIHTFPTASYSGASYMFSAIEDSTGKSTTYNVLVAQGNNKVAEIKTYLIKSEGSAPTPTVATAINAGNVELRVTDTGTFTYRGIVQLF